MPYMKCEVVVARRAIMRILTLQRMHMLITSTDLIYRVQHDHLKRILVQSSSLPIAISRGASPSIEASAAAMSGSAGSPPRFTILPFSRCAGRPIL